MFASQRARIGMGDDQPHIIAQEPAPSAPPQGEPAQRSRGRSRRRRFAAWASERSGQPLATALLGTLLIGAPQLFGGVLPWTINVIACMSVVCAAAIGARAPTAAAAWPLSAGLMALACLWTVLQAVPLPCNFVALISPHSAYKLRAGLQVLGGAGPRFCTISHDPGGTQQEIVKGFAVLCTFVASWLFAASGGRRRVIALIACSTLAMSLVALAHALFEQDRVFGVYTPVGITRQLLLAPLMNSNNLGAFAALGPPLWIGLTYRDENPNLRLLGYVAVVLTTTTTLLSLSRGAIGQLFASAIFLLWFIVRQRARAKAKQRTPLPARELRLAIAAAGGVGLAAYVVGKEVLKEISNTDLTKLELSARVFKFVANQPWLGIGRGAFSSAFVGQEGTVSRYRYAENFVAHWAAEWGAPVALALLLAIAVDFWRAQRQRSVSLARLGAVTALLCYAAQNLVDFGFELLGPAVVAAALLAGCVAPSAERGASDERPVASWRRSSALAFAAVGCGLAALVLFGPRLARNTVAALEGELYAAQTRGDRAGFRQQLRAALELHPSEPSLALMAASESIAHKDPKSGAWLNRSMHLAPGWARPHVLAFRWLWQGGHGRQALLELRSAAEIDPDVAIEDACRLGAVDVEWILESAPRNKFRRNYLERVGECVAWYAKIIAPLDELILREFPDSPLAVERSARRLQQEGELDAGLALLDRLIRRRPEYHHATVARFQLLLAAGRLQDVIDGADGALASADEATQVEILGTKAAALARAGSMELAREALNEIRRRASTDPTRLANSYELEGKILLDLKQPGEALGAYREAYRIKQETSYLRVIGMLAESLGDRPQALWAYINLCQREPRSGGCERRNALLTPGTPNSAR